MVRSSANNSPTTGDWARLFKPPKDQASKVCANDLARVFGGGAAIRKNRKQRVSYTPDDEDA